MCGSPRGRFRACSRGRVAARLSAPGLFPGNLKPLSRDCCLTWRKCSQTLPFTTRPSSNNQQEHQCRGRDWLPDSGHTVFVVGGPHIFGDGLSPSPGRFSGSQGLELRRGRSSGGLRPHAGRRHWEEEERRGGLLDKGPRWLPLPRWCPLPLG